MLHHITSQSLGELMYLRIRDIEESPASSHKQTKQVVDHLWQILHGIEAKNTVINLSSEMDDLAMRAERSSDWAEREALNEAYAVARNVHRIY